MDEVNIFDRIHRCSISSEGIEDHPLNEFMGRLILQEKALELGKLKELSPSEQSYELRLRDTTQALRFMEDTSSQQSSTDKDLSSSSLSESGNTLVYESISNQRGETEEIKA
mmetsp:Transcript_14636/g.22699  ORF Transcript_14636/g.22699 Transcript_14636/m.22699 type:complete len:112 (+) Transcript_14636:617-952(+)